MKISVVIPCFNASAYLEQTLASVRASMAQTPSEVVVVDDGSTDNSVEVLEALSDQFSWMRFLTQSNAGPAVARNIGAKEARGDFLLFLDADDELLPGALESACKWIAESPAEADFLIGRYLLKEEDGSSCAMPCTVLEQGQGPQLQDYLEKRLAIGQGCYLIRRTRFLAMGFPETLSTQEDIPFFMACLAGLRCELMDLDMAIYHRYRGSVSQARYEALQEGFANMDILFEPPYVSPTLEHWRQVIYRRKARALLRYAGKNGSPADVLRVMGQYRERVGLHSLLDVRFQFKALKAIYYALRG